MPQGHRAGFIVRVPSILWLTKEHKSMIHKLNYNGVTILLDVAILFSCVDLLVHFPPKSQILYIST